MGYHRIDPGSVEPAPDRPCREFGMGDAAGLENVPVDRYAVDPGEEIPLAYHYHDEQEGVFDVAAGELHVETPERTYEKPGGQFFVVEPGSPQRAYNPEDDDGTVRTVGAPAVDDVHAYEPEA